MIIKTEQQQQEEQHSQKIMSKTEELKITNRVPREHYLSCGTELCPSPW